MSEPRKVYVTKWAATSGIRHLDCEEVSENGYAHVKVPGAWGTTAVCHTDWHNTLEEAQMRAREMARAKLKSLDKQRKRLEAIAKDGANVAGE